jgi:hypothetical protein
VPNKGAKRGHIILSLLLLTVVAQLFLLCSFLFAMGELHPACQPIHGTLVEYRMRMGRHQDFRCRSLRRLEADLADLEADLADLASALKP